MLIEMVEAARWPARSGTRFKAGGRGSLALLARRLRSPSGSIEMQRILLARSLLAAS